MNSRLVQQEQEIIRLQRALQAERAAYCALEARQKALRYRLVDQVNRRVKALPVLHRAAKTLLSRLFGQLPNGRPAQPGSVPPRGVAGSGRPAESRVSLLPDARSTEQPPAGVNVVGFFASEKGIGEEARSLRRALEAAGIPCAASNLIDATTCNLDREITNFSDHHPYPVNILAVNAPELGVVWEQRGSHWLQGRYNIGYWCWELPELPRDWYQGFAYFQEVWVASRFVLDGVSRTSPIPVVRIPYCIPNPVLSLPGLGPSSFGLPAGRFTFLFCFDFMSEMERKNPLGLIEAFQQAFGSSRDVLLVIKTSHAHTVPSAYEKLKASTTENVCILDGNLERSALTSLFSLADCFVSLHRSEGFGLALAEAMGLGKPVIATAYSGNLDYMTPTNSFLVRYRLTEITADHGSYRRGGIWAQPDLDHAAELMRFVYHHREEAARIARQGQEDIKHWFSPTAVGQQVCERLEMIQQGTKPS